MTLIPTVRSERQTAAARAHVHQALPTADFERLFRSPTVDASEVEHLKTVLDGATWRAMPGVSNREAKRSIEALIDAVKDEVHAAPVVAAAERALELNALPHETFRELTAARISPSAFSEVFYQLKSLEERQGVSANETSPPASARDLAARHEALRDLAAAVRGAGVRALNPVESLISGWKSARLAGDSHRARTFLQLALATAACVASALVTSGPPAQILGPDALDALLQVGTFGTAAALATYNGARTAAVGRDAFTAAGTPA